MNVDGGVECPVCRHPHLPMSGPWTTSSGRRVDPLCDWPESDGSGCTCRRRNPPRPSNARVVQAGLEKVG